MTTLNYSDQSILTSYTGRITRIRPYRDIDLTFTRHPTTNDVVTLLDMEAVKRAVKNIIMTSFYERPFNPNFGTGIRNSLFDLMDGFTTINLEEEIRSSLKNYEPRIVVNNVEVISEEDYNQLAISIEFTIINTKEESSIDIILKRTK